MVVKGMVRNTVMGTVKGMVTITFRTRETVDMPTHSIYEYVYTPALIHPSITSLRGRKSSTLVQRQLFTARCYLASSDLDSGGSEQYIARQW